MRSRSPRRATLRSVGLPGPVEPHGIQAMPYKAHFEPQAWINDNAMTVDTEGEQTWDCTAFIEADAELKAEVDEAIADEGHFIDRDDVLMGDEAAPQWVQNW